MEKGKIEVIWKTDKWGIKLDVFLIILAILISLISLAIDLIDPCNTLFSRSGSIVVLIGAMLEVRQLKHQEAYNQEFQRNLIQTGIISPIYSSRLTGVFKTLRNITHGLVLAGTIIWGYGDLPFKG